LLFLTAITGLTGFQIEQAKYRTEAYTPYMARREAIQPGRDQMFSEFPIFRVEADGFTWQESSTSIGVAKARTELHGAEFSKGGLAVTS
jgi:hypothetical protein